MTDEAPQNGFSWPVVVLAGLLLGTIAGFAYYVRANPCPCGERQVDEVAKASAEIAEGNGKRPPRAKKVEEDA